MTRAATTNQVTLVIPVFNEEAVLPELLGRLTALFDKHPAITWRALLVNDGSRDQSAQIIRAQNANDARFQLLELTRNFGFQAALAAGLAEASGDALVTLDADLQDPPELIFEMYEKSLKGFDVVYARRVSRQGETFIKKIIAKYGAALIISLAMSKYREMLASLG